MKFGTFHLFQKPPGWGDADVFSAELEQIEKAEELGFDAVWLAEHHFQWYGIATDLMVIAGWVAARTQRVRIGTAIVVLPFHNPVRLAEQTATIDLMSGGRLDFGVGRGYQAAEYAGFGLSMDESRASFNECMEVLLKAWTEETFSYDGQYTKVNDVTVLPKPVQKPHPPVLVGGGLPDGARRALAYGDGWMPHAKRPTYRLLDKLAEYREMEKAARRTLPITAFGAEHDPSAWGAYRDAGIDRIVLSINSEASDAVLPQLDRWAAKLAGVR